MSLDLIDDDETKPKKENTQQPGQQAVQAPEPAAGNGPSQPTGAVNTTGQGLQSARTTGKTGSGFVNLQNVINANKQNKLGSTINQGLQGVAGNVKQGLQSNQDLFQQEMNKNSIGGQADVQGRQSVIDRITGYQAPTTVQAGGPGGFNELGNTPVNTAGQGPQALGDDLVSQDEAANFQRYRSGAYQGPQSLRDVDNLQEQAQRAEDLGKNISSTGGRQALLQQFVGQNSGYSRGKQALDSLLLGQTGAKDLRDARKATFGLGNQVSGAENLAEQQGAAAASTAQQFGQDTKNLLGGKDQGGLIGDIYGGLNQATQDRQAQADAEYKNFQDRLNNKQLTQDDINKYVNPILSNKSVDQNTSLFGLTPEQLQSAYAGGKFNLEDLADTSKIAKINALQKLAGTNDIQLDPTKLGAHRDNIITDPTQFESYRGKQDEINGLLGGYNDLLSQTQGRQDYYNNEVKNTLANNLKMNLDNIRNSKKYDSYGAKNVLTRDTAQQAQDYYNALTSAASNPSLAKYGDVKNQIDAFANKFKTDKGYNLPNYMHTGAKGGDNYVNDQAMKDFLDSGNLGSTLNYDKSADITNLNKLIGGIKEQKGAGNSITSLMSDAERAKYEAAHPTQLQQVQRQGNEGLYDQAKYNDLYNKYLGAQGSTTDLGGGQTLDSLLGGHQGLARLGLIGGTAGIAGSPLANQIVGGIGDFGRQLFGGASDIFSDKRLKKDIKKGDKHVQSFLDSITPQQYEYKNSEHGIGKHLGIMAQDLEKTDEGRSAVEEHPEGKKVNFGKLAGMMMASQADIHQRLKLLEGKKK